MAMLTSDKSMSIYPYVFEILPIPDLSTKSQSTLQLSYLPTSTKRQNATPLLTPPLALTLASHTLAAPLPQNDPAQTLENRTPPMHVKSEDVPDLSWEYGNAKRAALQKCRASDTVHWIDGTDLEKREPNQRAAAETDPDLAFVDEKGNIIHK
ncbi:MAG: hypothetical protein M1836_000016 [Candelina mexicana]|nr:MAG: hypothetical protein M1836_000016 [Candelina mexicana]